MSLLPINDILDLLGSPDNNPDNYRVRLRAYLQKYVHAAGDVAEYMEAALLLDNCILLHELLNHIGKLLGFVVEAGSGQPVIGTWVSGEFKLRIIDALVAKANILPKEADYYTILVGESQKPNSNPKQIGLSPLSFVKLFEYCSDAQKAAREMFKLLFPGQQQANSIVDTLIELSNQQLRQVYKSAQTQSRQEDERFYYLVPTSLLNALAIVKEGIWVLERDSLLHVYLQEHDWIILYVSGIGFIAYARVDSLPIHLPSKEKSRFNLTDDYTYYIQLKENYTFGSPRPLSHSLRKKLEAFKQRGEDKSWRWLVEYPISLSAKDFRNLTEEIHA